MPQTPVQVDLAVSAAKKLHGVIESPHARGVAVLRYYFSAKILLHPGRFLGCSWYDIWRRCFFWSV